MGVYGTFNLGGELAVRTSGARHAIVRTAWVVSAHGHNFVKTMLCRADLDRLSVVDDQHGSPTSAADLAAALVTVATELSGDAAAAGQRAAVSPIAIVDYPTPARRPANSLLDTGASRDRFGIAPRPWQDALCDILDDLIGAVT